MSRYQDIASIFEPHPLNGDLIVKNDANAIKQSIRNLVTYNFYEKPFNPTVASEVTGFLFSNGSSAENLLLQNAIRQVIENFEPRANVTTVNVKIINASIRVQIMFDILNLEQNVEIEFFLEKVR